MATKDFSEEELPEITEPPTEPDGPVEPEPVEPIDPWMETFGFLGYVTLDEANTYVSEHYMSTEDFRIGWEALEDADKAALLRRSFQAIELLPFSGRKTCCSQPFAFPRWPSEEVPLAVKFAQIEQSLVGSDTTATEEAKQYEKMWQWGVSSYTIGNLSESISAGTYGAGALRTAGITSAAAARFLAPYLQGGYNIR